MLVLVRSSTKELAYSYPFPNKNKKQRKKNKQANTVLFVKDNLLREHIVPDIL